MEIKGQCLCGKIKVTMKEPPLRTFYCYCSDCAITCSSPGSAVVISKASSIIIEGDTVTYSTNKTKSGNTKHMHFCANCFTGVNSDMGSGLVSIRGGIFTASDQIDLLVPKKAIFMDQRTEYTDKIGQFIHSKL